ncbi:hypothetical protein [Schaalia cardiffensis]|uniref:hypothetical protein n=1 Tax=Schaalia cardiffensis TaxID=181487 RepID=UPI002AAF9E94|nr:hypothetical protein [Schaalia cardiffensis]
MEVNSLRELGGSPATMCLKHWPLSGQNRIEMVASITKSLEHSMSKQQPMSTD